MVDDETFSIVLYTCHTDETSKEIIKSSLGHEFGVLFHSLSLCPAQTEIK
jgi:hypothetical protein